ncbi:MAG: glycosyltransferase family 39 protein [Anaerolineales bacterium]|nr:glycosyltransferase family 39 protein [Anaerolineales bacterium]
MEELEQVISETGQTDPEARSLRIETWLPAVALILILILAAALRFTGLNWDENTHLHPDERFLTMVETSLQLPDSVNSYFNTEESLMNPHNVGFGFFVYGTFPIFLVRVLAEWTAQTGYDSVQLVGRAVSASADLVTILFIFMIGRRLYGSREGLLAAFLAAGTALLIQHAHFFVVEPVLTMFVTMGIYFTVRIYDEGNLWDYAAFGAVLGFAASSKISIAPLAALAVVAALGKMFGAASFRDALRPAFLGLSLAAILSLIIFRLAQPYAFEGPNIWNVLPNPAWLANISEIAQQNKGNTDAPYALQWANRTPVWFALKNLVLWGMGAPLGIAGWVGWGWAVYEVFRKRWRKHFILAFWVGAYFLWQSTSFTPAMRYQLPVYPALILLAAWGLWTFWDRTQGSRRIEKAGRVLAAAMLTVVSVGTILWGLAFTEIYARPVTRVDATRWIFENVPAVMNVVIGSGEQQVLENVPMPEDFLLMSGAPHIAAFTSYSEGEAVEILFAHVSEEEGESYAGSLTATLLDDPNAPQPLAVATFLNGEDRQEGEPLRLELDRPVFLHEGTTYWIRLDWNGGAALHLRGSVITSETTWDDGLPLRLDGRDIGGRYIGQNLELYWPDEQDEDQNGLSDKFERILGNLSSGDFLIITSNRQYGTIPRVPQRYPLTTEYYRELMGCPITLSVPECYALAQPGDYVGSLGYELIEVFDSSPRIGNWVISDQMAEEALTVYDHPRVLIFRRAADFSEQAIWDALGDVDPFTAVHVLPRDAGDPPLDLMLDEETFAAQQASGTWAELFPRDSLVNRSQLAAVFFWWSTLTALGIAAYPLLRIVLPGFSKYAYPLARAAGLLLFAWSNWMLGSLGIPVTRATVLAVFLVMVVAGAALIIPRRRQWLAYLKSEWREIVFVEVASLGLFIAFLLVRFGNPDLWHPAKGGEKPMDFSYFNAILRSVSFPPYDPWFAGGYINYYYFGFVIVGMPVKLLGINPAVAYNLILPTIFSVLGMMAYGVAANLVDRLDTHDLAQRKSRARTAGIAAALLLVVLGNLGTLRMFYEGFQQIGAQPGETEGGFLSGPLDAVRGFGSYVTFQREMPYGLDQWYWNPSREIPAGEGEAGPITEFPYFTLLYADLHAHLISRIITMLALGWAIAWVFSAREQKKIPVWQQAVGLTFGGLVLGALPPTNTWDFPVFWLLGAIAAGYAVWRRSSKTDGWTLVRMVLSAGVLVAAARFLYLPYHQTYGQGYMNVDPWEGSLTQIKDYLYVFGLFLFLITSWLASETWTWMAETPAAVLRKQQTAWVLGLFLVVFTVTGLLFGMDYKVALLVIPLAAWDGLLLFRARISLEKQILHVLIGGALALTFLVELVVLRGDISRMNTVFKFYLQAWELLSIAGGVCFAVMLYSRRNWNRMVRATWTAVAGFLVFSAALYPLMATPAKIDDRMARDAPNTLDGSLFMAFATYYDMGQAEPLRYDYEAIRWMQDHVEGTPVIVEANIPEYRWGSRFTIYTGLPAVLGWNWHQRQQRVSVGDPGVTERALAITDFYMTQSIDQAEQFLERYDVSYIVLGTLESMYFDQVRPCWPSGDGSSVSCDLGGWPMGMYSPEVSPAECTPLDPDDEFSQLQCPTFGLDKFPLMEQMGLLRSVYVNDETTIIEVVR